MAAGVKKPGAQSRRGTPSTLKFAESPVQIQMTRKKATSRRGTASTLSFKEAPAQTARSQQAAPQTSRLDLNKMMF